MMLSANSRAESRGRHRESPKTPSLQKTIFSHIVAFALFIVVILIVGFAAVFYAVQESENERMLMAQASSLAEELNGCSFEEQESIVSVQRNARVRISLIDDEGTVVFDTNPRAYGVNHGDRPEVGAAIEQGEASLVRQSATIGSDLVYAAVRLDDGAVLRLSMERQSISGFLGSLMAPLLGVAAIVVLIVFLVSRRLSRRILGPIDAIDVENPLGNEIYSEMTPLLESIDRQQRQLKAQNEELARAESFRREFSSNVSHELKTPLQVIAGYAELINNGLLDMNDLQRVAGIINDEANAMRSIIDDVLILSRLDESAFDQDAQTLVDLRAVAERIFARLEPVAREKGVCLCLEGECAQIWCNETLIEMALSNLVENGIRYNVAGGEVTLALSDGIMAEGEGSIALGGGAGALPNGEAAIALSDGVMPDGALREGALSGVLPDGEMPRGVPCAVIAVSDTGVGIAEDEQQKIFERFYRIEKSRSKETGGTGLGLAIVKHAVAYHRGTIEVSSELGAGTTFVVKIPLRASKRHGDG